MAELGRQNLVPGYKSNSTYALGATKYIIMAHIGQYQAVMATDANSSTILGVLQNAPNAGQAASIAYEGPSKVVAGGALTAGAFFTTNASGRAAAITSGNMVVGRILETSANDGDVVSALLIHPVRWGQVI